MSDNLWIIGGAEKPSAHGSMTESIETVDIWDHNSRSWRPLTKMATARHSHSVSSIGYYIFFLFYLSYYYYFFTDTLLIRHVVNI